MNPDATTTRNLTGLDNTDGIRDALSPCYRRFIKGA